MAAADLSAWTFTDVTTQAGLVYAHGYSETDLGGPEIVAGGVAAGDYDRDGWVDLYVVRGSIGPNLLFRNRGNGTFEEVGAAAGVALSASFGTGPTFADVDGDGWLDLLVLGIACPRRFAYCDGTTGIRTTPTLFRNRGDGTFEDVTASSGIVVTRDSFSAAFGDYDRDGDLDLFITHWGDNRPPGSSEQLWRNDGHCRFTDVSGTSGIAAGYTAPRTGEIADLSFTPNFADIDGDGWPDLLVAGDFRLSKVFRNNADGTFANVTTPVISDENGMGGAVGDYDNDGDLDWFVSSIWDPNGVAEGNWFTSGNRLYRNRGDGTFEDVTDAAGVRQGYWGWGSTFADLNNDGSLDLFHVNGWTPMDPAAFEFHNDPARAYISNGDGTFTERAHALGIDDPGQGRGVVAFDYDRDGNLDLFIANNQQPPRLYHNDGVGTGHFLSITLRGAAPNSEGIGARVYVTVGGHTQMRELRAGSNYESQDPAEAHFGLGSAGSADQVRIEWPGGHRSVLGATPGDRLLVVSEAVVPPACPGDCNGDHAVTIDELITMVNMALGTAPPAACPAETGEVTIDHIIAGVNSALNGCPG